jgi:hypothetical protein
VAIHYVGVKTFGRSGGKRGSRATSAAAYRAGERIRDERTGTVYDHHRRRDVMHKEIVLPSKLARAGRELDWARDRARLWNAAEHAEVRKNARVAREFVVALPHELSHGQRTLLARRFAQELANRYGNAIDVAIHAPRGDPRNFHAHLLATTREITPEGLGRKTTLELSGTERHRLGLPRWMEETTAIRERWAMLANESLENAHVAARLAPTSRTSERSQRLSPPRVPLIAYHIEQRGGRSFVAERIRAAHREMLARAETHVAERAETKGLARIEPKGVEPTASATRTTVLQQLWGRAREAWAALSGISGGRAVDELSRGRALDELSRGHVLKDSSRGHAPSGPGGSPVLQSRVPVAPPLAARQQTLLQRTLAQPDAPALEAARQGSRARSVDEIARESARKWAQEYGLEARQAGHSRTLSADDSARASALNWLRYREQDKRQHQAQGHPRDQERHQEDRHHHEQGHEQERAHKREQVHENQPQHEADHGRDYDLGL